MSWSIAGCSEHITLTEKFFFRLGDEHVEAPADLTRTGAVKKDAQMKAVNESRDHKAKAPESLKPMGKPGYPEIALQTFEQQSTSLFQYVQSAKDDLRHYYAQTPVGTVNAYQLLLFLTPHTRRHTAQIQAIKADPLSEITGNLHSNAIRFSDGIVFF